MSAVSDPPPKLPRRAFGIIFGVSMATALGNTGLISVLPVIGRSLQVPDFLVSAIFSLSAILWAVSSPFWARSSDLRGRKPLMMLGLTGFMVSMICCGAVVTAGLHHLAPPMIIFGLLLVARAIFGLFGAASNPATQAYVAEHTSREDRTQSMANLAGAFGLGTVIGPFVAPLFIVPSDNVAGPLFGFAVIAAVMMFVVYRFLPESPFAAEAKSRARQLQSDPRGRTRGGSIWKDPRLAPFLIYGFLVSVCQTAQGQTLGFLIIDQMHLSPSRAQEFIAVAMMFGAVAGLLAQWGVIRMFELGPRSLMRWGVAVATIGMLLVAAAASYPMVVAGYAISSLGFGLARPGFTAGSSLSVSMDEQARAAGAIAAVNGINVIFAPGFVWLYQHIARLPFLIAAAILVGLMIYTFTNRTLRDIGSEPTTKEETIAATIERSDEGGV
jgi:MFS family permease